MTPIASLALRLPPLGSQPDRLGERAALLGVIWCYHRIVGVEAPLLTILIRSHLIMGHQMPLQHFEALTVLQADDIVGLDRRTDWHLGLRLGFGGRARAGQLRQRSVNIRNQ